MTNFAPFPPDASRRAAATAKASYDARRKRPLSVGETEECADMPCYRLPDGGVRPVYDPYRPDYPRGAVPGFGTWAMTLEFYPNETTGYRIAIRDFVPL